MKKILCALLAAALLSLSAFAGDVRVGVIDTGVRIREDYLDADRILPGKNYLSDSGSTPDEVGHGTRVASLILGTKDGAIRSPCTETAVVPLVYYSRLASGTVQNGGVEAICRALYDAVDLFGCRIVNLSSGIAGKSPQLEEAVAYALDRGVLLIASAGNDGKALTYPAACSGVIAVGSCDADGAPSAFSARGPELTLLAPGEDLQTLSIRNGEAYETVSGTSYAAAKVTAEAAALLERHPEWTAHQLRFLLQQSCRDVCAPGRDDDSGFGVLDPVLLRQNAEALAAGRLLCYTDVPPDSRVFDAVRQAEALGLMQGTADYVFSPEQTVTRAEAAVILHRLAGLPAPTGRVSFSDVPPDGWYGAAAAWAEETGLIRGYAGAFRPMEPVTGEQMALILCRCAEALGLSWTPEPEAAAPSGASLWAQEAVLRAVASGLIRQGEPAFLSPSAGLQRGDTALLLTRFAALLSN